jgi:hypothetical protein
MQSPGSKSADQLQPRHKCSLFMLDPQSRLLSFQGQKPSTRFGEMHLPESKCLITRVSKPQGEFCRDGRTSKSTSGQYRAHASLPGGVV